MKGNPKKYDVTRITKTGEIKLYLRGWTAEELAKKLNVHSATIYKAAVRGKLLLKKYYIEEAK